MFTNFWYQTNFLYSNWKAFGQQFKTLRFNKISKSNIILLDECLASLHSELVEDIVELIKNKLGDKLVLFTLHQANTGMFDTIVDIGKLKDNSE